VTVTLVFVFVFVLATVFCLRLEQTEERMRPPNGEVAKQAHYSSPRAASGNGTSENIEVDGVHTDLLQVSPARRDRRAMASGSGQSTERKSCMSWLRMALT
jgi:hypothetical protein